MSNHDVVLQKAYQLQLCYWECNIRKPLRRKLPHLPTICFPSLVPVISVCSLVFIYSLSRICNLMCRKVSTNSFSRPIILRAYWFLLISSFESVNQMCIQVFTNSHSISCHFNIQKGFQQSLYMVCKFRMQTGFHQFSL